MPEDTTPHGGEAFHAPPQRARIPDPPPQGTDTAAASHADSATRPDRDAISLRPALPEHPQARAVDIEDEDADPVGDTGAGLEDPGDTGVASVTRQPGG